MTNNAIRERILDTLHTADHNGKLDAIESVVDSCENFAEFVELLGEMCSTTADKVAAEHGEDQLMVEIWNRRAAYLINMSPAIERSFD